jgi:hypothetical protein
MEFGHQLDRASEGSAIDELCKAQYFDDQRLRVDGARRQSAWLHKMIGNASSLVAAGSL